MNGPTNMKHNIVVQQFGHLWTKHGGGLHAMHLDTYMHTFILNILCCRNAMLNVAVVAACARTRWMRASQRTLACTQITCNIVQTRVGGSGRMGGQMQNINGDQSSPTPHEPLQFTMAKTALRRTHTTTHINEITQQMRIPAFGPQTLANGKKQKQNTQEKRKHRHANTSGQPWNPLGCDAGVAPSWRERRNA